MKFKTLFGAALLASTMLVASAAQSKTLVYCSEGSPEGFDPEAFDRDKIQKTIWMMDDNIAANRGHFTELLDAIMGEGLHKKACFHGSMRGDNISDDILDKAKAANFKMISFGLETGSESLMKVIILSIITWTVMEKRMPELLSSPLSSGATVRLAS